MQIIAIIKNKTPMESGTSANGNTWKRIILVVETIQDHPKDVAITFLNNMADVASRELVGNVVKISLDAESRLFEGRYYTELRGYNIRPAYQATSAAPAPQQPNSPQPMPTSEASPLPYPVDNLPLDIDNNPL